MQEKREHIQGKNMHRERDRVHEITKSPKPSQQYHYAQFCCTLIWPLCAYAAGHAFKPSTGTYPCI